MSGQPELKRSAAALYSSHEYKVAVIHCGVKCQILHVTFRFNAHIRQNYSINRVSVLSLSVLTMSQVISTSSNSRFKDLINVHFISDICYKAETIHVASFACSERKY